MYLLVWTTGWSMDGIGLIIDYKCGYVFYVWTEKCVWD